ncbi:prepilin-type N-terminal cleavage/methylation domain-containing protein [Rahnella inusitata]|uniref:prepilin-type N-terminal cleavage/methylation domain-containing protein n=1 Tax=Rahnella inusitata TaxID=58169 RepID=UPI001BC837AE|nr:prepilin-type N-terminal cleavage/methylation domain-containing protein [Rahnella inusitata]QUT16384.1 prepilin-type N-terminal cleavage/methylation domain-containing protein [Rahnella inusitata]
MTEKEINQQGFSLPEVMIAALLLSVSVLGLLNYFQSLSQGFMRQWQVQQAWSEAHSELEAYSVSGNGTQLMIKDWEYQISGFSAGQRCILVSVIIRSPAQYQARLQRLVCEPDTGKPSA